MSKTKNVDHYASLLRAGIEERPYEALAIAAGVGIVIGTGLWKHALRSLLSVGGRIAVTAALASLAEQTALSSSGAGGSGNMKPHKT